MGEKAAVKGGGGELPDYYLLLNINDTLGKDGHKLHPISLGLNHFSLHIQGRREQSTNTFLSLKINLGRQTLNGIKDLPLTL